MKDYFYKLCIHQYFGNGKYIRDDIPGREYRSGEEAIRAADKLKVSELSHIEVRRYIKDGFRHVISFDERDTGESHYREEPYEEEMER